MGYYAKVSFYHSPLLSCLQIYARVPNRKSPQVTKRLLSAYLSTCGQLFERTIYRGVSLYNKACNPQQAQQRCGTPAGGSSFSPDVEGRSPEDSGLRWVSVIQRLR